MELQEVDQKKVNNIMFKRIGVDVPMLSNSEGFELDHLPVRALAVSSRFGYAVFAHSRGFSVAKTSDLVELAQKLDANAEEFKTAQEAGSITVDVTNIRSLALSSDELTVCVCAGGDVLFYEVATLVHTSDTRPFEVWQVHRYDGSDAKDFLWSPSKSEAYLVVTSHGKLLLGHIGSVAECKVEEGVVAASWSADGQHLAYVSDNRLLSIATSNFATTFRHELPTHLSDEDDDSDLQVDAIRWVRPDSIVIGYLQVNSEGEEDEYPLFVLNARNGNLAQEGNNLLGLVFYQLFPSVDPFVVPSGSGPYMLSDYFKPWELMVAASRKSIDDHIVLMGWYPEDGRDVLYSLELGNDVWIPRIELQESSEDNAILGLAIDRTTVQIELSDPTDESGDTKLPPCPVLICLTLEGKLSFFSVARLGGKSEVPDLVTRPSNVPSAKRSIPQPSSQLTSKPVTTTALFPLNPAVVKVEPPKDIRSSSELIAQAEVLHQGEDVKEAPSQSGFMIRTKLAVNDERDTLFQRLTSTSHSFLQVAAGDHPSEYSRLGSTLFSDETKKSMGIPTSPSVMTLRDLTGSVNVASSFQGLFRPFDDASKSGQVTVKPVPPPQVPWFSQLPSTSSLPVTCSGPLHNIQTGPLPTESAQSKGFEGGPASNATVLFGRGSQDFHGGAAANPAVSSGPGLQGKGFQGGAAISLSGPFGLGSQGKGFQGGPAANSTVSFGPGSQGKGFQGETAANSNVSLGSGFQRGLAGNPTAAFGASVKSPLGSPVAPKVVFSQRGADRFTRSSRILQDQQSAGRTPGVTDMEAAFNAELEEVRKMSEDVDQLMSYIEGGWQGDANQAPVAFTRQALEALEQGIHRLSEECKVFRVQLNKNKDAIEDLRDEEMRVDAWRIYIQSLMDQKNDSRYQELWNNRKLHPELEMKRKRLVKADQELKQQIAELEGHLHLLELKQFQLGNTRRRTSKQAQSPGRFLSVQNLYNTVNSQMAVAEELSSSLAKQMEALNIKWSPQTPKSTASKILTSVGADTDDSENLLSPLPRTRLSYSATRKTGSMNGFLEFSVQDKEPNLQETTRRRRDSMDAQAWVNRETPITTIKRLVRTKPSQNISPNDSTVPKFRQGLQASSDVPVSEKSHFSQNAQPVHFGTGLGPRSATQSFPDPGFEGSAPSFRRTGIVNSTPQWPSSQPEVQPQEQPQAQPQAQQPAQAHAKLQAKPQAQPQAPQRAQAQQLAQAQAKLQAKPQAQPQAQQQSQAQAKLHAKPQAQPQAQQQAQGQAKLQANSQPQAQLPAKLQAQPQSQPQAQQTGPGPSFPSADLKGSSSAAHQGSAGQVMNTNSKESMFKWANSTATTVTSVSKEPIGSFSASSSAPAVSVVPATTATTSIFSAPTVSIGLFSGSSSISNATQATSSSGYMSSTSIFVPKQSSGSLFTSSSVPAVSAVGTPATTAAATFFSGPTVTAGQFSGSSSTSNAKEAPLSSGSTWSTSITSVTKPSSGSLFASSSVPALTVVGAPATTSIFCTPTVSTGLFSGSSSTSNSTQASTSSGSAFSTLAPSIVSQSSGSLSASSSVPAISAVGASATTATTSIFSGSSSTSNAAQAFASSGSAYSTSILSIPNQSSGSLFASSSVPEFQTSSSQSISPSPFGQSTFGQSSPFGQVAQQHIQQPFMSPGSSAISTSSNATVALPPAESNEEAMEEEVSTSTAGLGTFGGFSGLGLGSSATGAQTQKGNPFGGSSFGITQPFQLTPPTGGQLFRPATFNLPAAQSSPQQSGGSTFGSGFGSSGFSQNNLFSETGKGFGSPPQSAGGFGQPAQLGPGQQALGSALGAFGQTRQVGFGTPFVNSGVGSASGGGFANTSPSGGFASTATGGGFAKASTGGGFAGAAMGGGFAGAATGGGFAAAASGAGFGGPGGAGGGFGGLAGGGFQAISGNQAAPPGFGSGVQPAQTSLFTQMRK